jgi:S1-C subfamily serine protease
MYEYDYNHKTRKRQYDTLILIAIVTFSIGIVIGGVFAYSSATHIVSNLQSQITDLSYLSEDNQSTTIEYYIDDTSLSDLYLKVKDSIVTITGVIEYQNFFHTSYTTIQGSGFIYQYDDDFYVITNNHVISDSSDLVVTFSNGNAYAADLVGADSYSDLAVLQVDAPDSEFITLTIGSSSDLKIGDPVVAIGTPLGLDTTMTTGIISQLGRTIEESLAGSFPIANIIQTDVAINSGNSGGPLLNYNGEVVGITTAIIEDSEGIGFAIPSDTILKETGSLVSQGYYTNHSWLGISGIDMTYAIAGELDVDVTYGWLVTYISQNSAASQAGLHGGNQQIIIVNGYVVVGGDIIIGIDGNRVINGDNLMTYLELNTIPGQIITLTIIRDDEILNVPVELGQRPVLN